MATFVPFRLSAKLALENHVPCQVYTAVLKLFVTFVFAAFAVGFVVQSPMQQAEAGVYVV